MFIISVMPSNHLILCHPLLLLPSIFPTISVFSIQSVLRIRWPKYWSSSFSISLSNEYSNEYSGLISFRFHWFDLLAAQGTPKSLLQHHSSKASILQRSAFFIVQLSHPYMTTGKTIALTRWCILAREMDVNSRHQYQNQFRTDSTREQVWGRRWSSFFSLIKTSVLTDFFFATMCNYFHLKFKGFSSRDV